MAFDFVTVNVSINGDTPQAQWRQDAIASSVVVCGLSSNVGVVTYRWRLIGRPEGSGTGSTGPEPIALGTASTAAFTIDIPGTYIVECLINGGAPDATIITAGVAYLETITTDDLRPLRLIGPGETNQDISDPLVAQGWIKQLNRWLRYLSAVSGGGGSDHLVLVQAGGTPGTLAALITSADGSVIATVTGAVPNLQLSLTANPNNPAGLYYLLGGSHSTPPTGLSKQVSVSEDYSELALTSSYVAIVTASTLTNDPGIQILPSGSFRLRLSCFASVASTLYFTISQSGSEIATGVANPVNLPVGSSYMQVDAFAVAATDTYSSINGGTDPLVLKVYAKVDSGSGTLRIGTGVVSGVAQATTLSLPFVGRHAYTHCINGSDALPAASTALAGLIQLSSATPQPIGTATSGSTGLCSDAGHVHGKAAVVPKRFYLTDHISDLTRGESNGFLLSLTNPTDEAHAVDLTPPGASQILNWFDSPIGEPGLITWPSGVVKAHLRARVLNPHDGLTYNLYPGDGSIVYESVLGRSDGITYQTTPYPTGPIVTGDYSTVEMDLYVIERTGSTALRLRADLILQATGSGSITDEVLELRCGGDNASYFDTLFVAAESENDHLTIVQAGSTPGTLEDLITSDDDSVVVTVTGTTPNLQLNLQASTATAADTPNGFLWLQGSSHCDWGLERNPDTVNVDNFEACTISSSSSVEDGLLFEGVLDQDDPGLVVWMAGFLRAYFYAKVSAASATLHLTFGRRTFPGDVVSELVTVTVSGAFSNTDFAIITQSTALAESVGNISDQFYLKVWATTTSDTPITVTLGTGLNCRSNINVPVPCLCPAYMFGS